VGRLLGSVTTGEIVSFRTVTIMHSVFHRLSSLHLNDLVTDLNLTGILGDGGAADPKVLAGGEGWV